MSISFSIHLDEHSAAVVQDYGTFYSICIEPVAGRYDHVSLMLPRGAVSAEQAWAIADAINAVCVERTPSKIGLGSDGHVAVVDAGETV